MNRGALDPYARLVRPILFRLDPEAAHHLALALLRAPAILPVLRRFAPPAQPVELFGLTFRNPIGLAAGFDKNAVALPAWEALGFGFVEIGTVTAQAQPGNAKPRIFRLPNEHALINRLGFNNDGAEAIAARLAQLRASRRWPAIPIGINLGRSKAAPLAEAVADYLTSFRRLREFADYITLNVSSPNTPGLRSLQDAEALGRLLHAVAAENKTGGRPVPVLLKIAPDLSESALAEIIAACEAHGVAGIIATNTTLDHSAVPRASEQAGGLSGAPLRQRATEVIRFLRAHTALPIIGVGGICAAASAREKLDAGAQLLQVYTGYIYRGPALLREIVASLLP